MFITHVAFYFSNRFYYAQPEVRKRSSQCAERFLSTEKEARKEVQILKRMSDQFLFYNNKIEAELDKPENERNQDKLADWRAERAKLTSGKHVFMCCSPTHDSNKP